jgi:hypothetical protein
LLFIKNGEKKARRFLGFFHSKVRNVDRPEKKGHPLKGLSPIKGLVKRKNTPSIKKNNFFFDC